MTIANEINDLTRRLAQELNLPEFDPEKETCASKLAEAVGCSERHAGTILQRKAKQGELASHLVKSGNRRLLAFYDPNDPPRSLA